MTENEHLIALAGNPNVGKSTIFNALTGLRQHTGNWSGKTVGCAYGKCTYNNEHFVFADLPGTYSLDAHSAEEAMAGDFIRRGGAERVCIVCDAGCLSRGLRLALQVMAVHKYVLICVNLMDEAAKMGIHPDLEKLSRALNVPVVGMSAAKNRGFDELMAALCSTPEEHGQSIEYSPEELTSRANELAESCCSSGNRRQKGIDALLTHPIWGIPAMAVLLGAILWLTIKGANVPSEILSGFLFSLGETLEGLYTFLPLWMRSAIFDGIWRTAAWVTSVMLPPMAIFFPLFTLLEDAGYLPRVAFNLDYGFQKARGSGKQALTMCMGLGCNAAGVVGCRIIDSPRERMVAMLTNAFVPCNGKFPALIAIISVFFAESALTGAVMLSCLMALGVVMTLLFSRILSGTVLKGLPSSFALELPPYRRPNIGQVLVRSLLDRTVFVLGRALSVAAPAGLIIWALNRLELIPFLAAWLDPLGQLMGLSGMILLSFILGLPANEIVIPIILMCALGEGTLTEYSSLAQLGDVLRSVGWTEKTALCFLIFSLFHWPCSTTLLTIKKESGTWRYTILGAILPTLAGMALCMAVNIII